MKKRYLLIHKVMSVCLMVIPALLHKLTSLSYLNVVILLLLMCTLQLENVKIIGKLVSGPDEDENFEISFLERSRK